MTPQELKNSILQLAIQGKLVEQRPEEGTAEELYRQIQAEKQALNKAGKIKKEKPLPEIAEDEKPFDIPDSWKWVKFGEIVNYNMIPLVTHQERGYFTTYKLEDYTDELCKKHKLYGKGLSINYLEDLYDKIVNREI